jgi:hypothetical protein
MGNNYNRTSQKERLIKMNYDDRIVSKLEKIQSDINSIKAEIRSDKGKNDDNTSKSIEAQKQSEELKNISRNSGSAVLEGDIDTI